MFSWLFVNRNRTDRILKNLNKPTWVIPMSMIEKRISITGFEGRASKPESGSDRINFYPYIVPKYERNNTDE